MVCHTPSNPEGPTWHLGRAPHGDVENLSKGLFVLQPRCWPEAGLDVLPGARTPGALQPTQRSDTGTLSLWQ